MASDLVVPKLQQAKMDSKKSYTQIAQETGLTKVYVAQLLRGRTQLKLNEDLVSKLCVALPGLTTELVEQLKKIEEPMDIRVHEAAMHYGESIKEIIQEDFGDSILSGAGLACSVDKVEGVGGEDSVVISLKGKHSPYTEQMIVEPIRDISSTEEKKMMTITTLGMHDYVIRHNLFARFHLKHNVKNGVQIIQPRSSQRVDSCAFTVVARQIEYQLRIVYAEAEVPVSLYHGICYINHEAWQDELVQSHPERVGCCRWKPMELLDIAKTVE